MTTQVIALSFLLGLSSPEPTDAPEATSVAGAEEAKEAEEPEEPEDPKAAEKARLREIEFTPGVMVWLRGQARHAPRYDGSVPPAVDLFSRIRLQGELKWRAWSVFAQAQDHRAFGARGENVTGAVGFQQGWMKLEGKTKGFSGFVRAGRQEIAWGRHRLIGTWPWAPQGRFFDALQVQGQYEWAGLELMYAMMERPRNFTVPEAGDIDVHTSGAHLGGARVFLTPHTAFNAEIMGLIDWADISPTELTRRRRIGDIGARLWGEPVKGLTYDVEGHGQFGEVGMLEHRAWATAAQVRGRIPVGPVEPGVQLGYTIASGTACNDTPETGCNPTVDRDFFNFYPTNHPHYGILDQLGWSNMRDAEGGLFLRHGPTFEVSAIYHFFQLQNQRGVWRDAPGNLIGAGWDPTGAGSTLGHELDVQITAELWAPLFLQPGYGFFVPGSAARTLAGVDTQHFVFLWVIVEFPGKIATRK